MNATRHSLRTNLIMLALTGSLVLGTTDGLAVNPDFGDAPDAPGGPATGNPYPTLLAHDGARHTPTGPILGITLDTEADGQPNVRANGDDIAGATPDDEDGVFFPTILFPGFSDNQVTVTTSGTGPYVLNAWMDFNGDGDWADAGEQIFTDTVLAAGANPLTFTVPAGALPVRVYSRWRLNTAGGLSYDGAAADGEVEDYCHGSIHGQKWRDRNGDGKRDMTTEEGLNGYQIQLWDSTGANLLAFVGTHDMDHDAVVGINPITERGVYWMHGLPPNFYILREKANPNAVQTFPAKCGAKEYFFRMDCEVLGRTPPENPPVCGNELNWVDNCVAGLDDFFSFATVVIQPPAGPPFNGEPITLTANGDTLIQRGAPNPGPGASFQTEMLSMDLTGSSPSIGLFHVRAGTDQGLPQQSLGQVTERPSGEFEVDSFFDVFFEIEVPGQFGGQPLRPGDAIPIEAVPGITEVPPVGVDYHKLVGAPVPLRVFPYGPTDLSGFSIIEMVHKPIYGLDFGNKITNAKLKAEKRKTIKKLRKLIKKAKKQGKRGKVKRLTRKLKKCLRELRRL